MVLMVIGNCTGFYGNCNASITFTFDVNVKILFVFWIVSIEDVTGLTGENVDILGGNSAIERSECINLFFLSFLSSVFYRPI